LQFVQESDDLWPLEVGASSLEKTNAILAKMRNAMANTKAEIRDALETIVLNSTAR
jgi:hypothetical protein